MKGPVFSAFYFNFRIPCSPPFVSHPVFLAAFFLVLSTFGRVPKLKKAPGARLKISICFWLFSPVIFVSPHCQDGSFLEPKRNRETRINRFSTAFLDRHIAALFLLRCQGSLGEVVLSASLLSSRNAKGPFPPRAGLSRFSFVRNLGFPVPSEVISPNRKGSVYVGAASYFGRFLASVAVFPVFRMMPYSAPALTGCPDVSNTDLVPIGLFFTPFFLLAIIFSFVVISFCVLRATYICLSGFLTGPELPPLLLTFLEIMILHGAFCFSIRKNIGPRVFPCLNT